jgi:regulator of nucleoside diphosphate kinase
MWRKNRITVTAPDAQRLRAILGSRGASMHDREHLLDLREEFEQARIVDVRDIPADVVTLQSEVRVRDNDTGVSTAYTVVPPAQANPTSGHVSVLAPLGTALLGYREDDDIEWPMPGGVRRLKIERVTQPPGVTVGHRRRVTVRKDLAHVTA